MEGDGRVVGELPDTLARAVLAVTSVLTLVTRDALATTLATAAATYLTFRAAKYLYVRTKVATLRRENREAVEADMRRIGEALVDQDKDELKNISSLPWSTLVAKLQDGSLSAVRVLAAYQWAAVEVQGRTNAVVAFVPGAEEEARRLDSLPRGERGPLHGVPVSIKVTTASPHILHPQPANSTSPRVPQ